MDKKQALFEFNQLEALNTAVKILKDAAIATIPTFEREAHMKAYGAYKYVAERYQKEFEAYSNQVCNIF